MLSHDREPVQCREACRLATRLRIELGADSTHEQRFAPGRGQHPGQEQQIACLHGFHIHTERLRRRRELDPELFQALLGGIRFQVGTHSCLRWGISRSEPEAPPDGRRVHRAMTIQSHSLSYKINYVLHTLIALNSSCGDAIGCELSTVHAGADADAAPKSATEMGLVIQTTFERNV